MSHTWHVTVHLFDADDVEPHGTLTAAHATLTTSSGTSLEGYGRARRRPDDPEVREVGEELAAARALRDLADRLLRATSDDLSVLEHRHVRLDA
ncbi:dsRBD fold-containing protein [uncultured Cellulomonas sp.]|uniref:dsRBD fold-containing protein n=1 Tax=uncultured Cellulomonas sp. TaxID=189682 RepID=UPI00261959BA|nr:dsRBD fold-containing protein [uncultured Cellulomonas sp.]